MRKAPFVTTVILCMLAYSMLTAKLAITQTLETPLITPSAIPIGAHTSVTITIGIDDPTLISSSVNLVQVDENNKTVAIVGSLKDDGSGADIQAGDQIFTIQFNVSSSEVGLERSCISAAFKGILTRALSEVVGVFSVNQPASVETDVNTYVATLPLPPQEDLSHPAFPAGPIPIELSSSITTLTNSPELAIFQLGSIVLLGFAIPNVEALDGAITLMAILDSASIDTTALRVALAAHAFHRNGLEAGNLALTGDDIAVTFLPGATWYGGGFPRPAIYYVVNNTLRTHTILSSTIMDDLVNKRFFESTGLKSSASTVAHELVHALIFRRGCFSSSVQAEENLVQQMGVLITATVNVTILTGSAKTRAEQQRQQAVNDAIGAGGITCLQELGIVDGDNDGLADTWEIQHWGNLTTVNDPSGDFDGDTLTNLQEFNLTTNPTLGDTDGDGFSDGEEIAAGTNPLDRNSKPSNPSPGPQPGPNVGDFVDLPMLVRPAALALMNGDTQALVADGNKLLILDLSTREVEVVVEGLKLPIQIAIEGQGPTALVLDYGNPQFTGDPVGQLLRVNFVTGAKSVLTAGFIQPAGLAIEAGEQSALVTDANGVYRVNLTSGNISLLAFGVGSGGIAIEPGGTSALLPIVRTFEIKRINLQTNEISIVPSQLPGVIRGSGVAVAPDGSFALVSAGGGDGGIAKLDLTTGQSVQIFGNGLAVFGSNSVGDFRLTADASEVIFAWFSADSIGNRISRVRLSDKAINDVTYGIRPLALALEGDGSTILVTSGGVFGSLYRLDIASGVPELISGAGTSPTDLEILPGGQDALITAGRFFVATGDLFQVDLATHQATSIAITPAPLGVVAEPSGSTALITTGDTVSRVTLATGEVSIIVQGLVFPAGLALESSAQNVIVGSASNEVARVNLTTKAVTKLAITVGSALHVAVEPGDRSVLVVETSNGLTRIDIATGTMTELLADPTVSGNVAIEPGGDTALLATQEGIKRVRIK